MLFVTVALPQASQNWVKRILKRASEYFGSSSSSSAQVTQDEPEVDPEKEDPEEAPMAHQDEREDSGDDADVPLDGPTSRPNMQEYEAMWKTRFDKHARSVDGEFGTANLVPCPIPVLWQDCPHVPFEELKSAESQSRLAAARPISGLQEAGFTDGTPYYAHNRGDVTFRRRAPNVLSSTLGFVLNKSGGGHFKGLKPREVDALHEVLSWGRQPGNNDILRWWGPSLERYEKACKKLMDKFRSVIPEDCSKKKIRATRRDSLRSREEQLGSTLGEEATGYVTIKLGPGRGFFTVARA